MVEHLGSEVVEGLMGAVLRVLEVLSIGAFMVGRLGWFERSEALSGLSRGHHQCYSWQVLRVAFVVNMEVVESSSFVADHLLL